MKSTEDLAARALEPLSGPETFEAFFAEHRQELFATLWLLTGRRHEAEEVLQEAFVRVWERWDRVAEMQRPAGYLYRTAVNVWRSRTRRTALALRRVVHAIPTDEATAEVESRHLVTRALATLPPRQRAAVVLVDVLDLPSQDAAEALGIAASTVRVQLARARATLRERIDRP